MERLDAETPVADVNAADFICPMKVLRNRMVAQGGVTGDFEIESCDPGCPGPESQQVTILGFKLPGIFDNKICRQPE